MNFPKLISYEPTTRYNLYMMDKSHHISVFKNVSESFIKKLEEIGLTLKHKEKYIRGIDYECDNELDYAERIR